MPDPGHGKASCFSAGDLLTPWGEVPGIYTNMMRGKGLGQMARYLPEAIDDIEAGHRTMGRPVVPVLIVMGWAGNDVYGEGGYRGVRWNHRSEHMHNRSEADQEVTPNWCERQKARAERSCHELGAFKRAEKPGVGPIVIVGNADGDVFALPKAYNDQAVVKPRLEMVYNFLLSENWLRLS